MQNSNLARRSAYAILAVSFVLAACIILYNRQPHPDRPDFQFEQGATCTRRLNSGHWTQGQEDIRCNSSTTHVATCSTERERHWEWDAAALRECGHYRLSPTDVMGLLEGEWVALVGDSIARNVYAALLRLLAGDGTQQVVTGHKDFEHQLPGNIRASFHWAPYAANVSDVFRKWEEGGSAPRAMLLGVGLWHMLHVTSTPDFAAALQRLTQPAQRLQEQGRQQDLAMLSVSNVQPAKLKTEEKRRTMTAENIADYNQALAESGLLAPIGAFDLIDIHAITKGCGLNCTEDGIHYSDATYDAALQIWGNLLAMQGPK